ncbi:1-phosphatidylinositol 4,5-bisphosphate phosphodiesterase gamma-1-like [Anomaloglossus baeobatrachus]|uniref:1-phosphatidylinositol 4,5-bisphosphate phosphodiesterase gamma-1-like n=1 Tax=Anomaloglossus baeobatrachus TaxID=238106 RepID=UPI003F502593
MSGCRLPNMNGFAEEPRMEPGAVARSLRQLETGTVLTLFYQKKSQRPERRTFQIRLDSRQVVWYRSPEKLEGEVDIREIKEIRPGKNSRDFERFPEDARKVDAGLCFIILYGADFRLKTLSVAAFSEEEVTLWIGGLSWALTDTLRSPGPLQVERWLKKLFETMDRAKDGSVTLKDIKALLPQINYRVPSMRFLRDKLQEIEARSELSFTHFILFYKNLMFDAQKSIIEQLELSFPLRNVDRPALCQISLHDFQRFLQFDQKDVWASDLGKVREFLCSYMRDSDVETPEPVLQLDEVQVESMQQALGWKQEI